MKALEQAAREYADSLILGDAHNVSQQQFEEYAQCDFKAGVEFAQRWIPVEEELPPINEVVLLKTDFNFIVGFYTGNNKFRALTFSSIGIENLEINDITHWRPI